MILVVGSFMVDCVTSCKRAPKAGETVVGYSYDNFLGGKGANQAVAASRLGGEVYFAGKLGNDNYANDFLCLFKQEGINTENILKSSESTGIGSVVLEESGVNRIVVVPGANHSYTIKELENIEPLIKTANIIVAQLELRIEVVERLGELCKKYKKVFILNPAPAHILSNSLLQSATYLTPNESELAMLTNKACNSISEITENAKLLLKDGPKNIIVTLGDNGALLINKDESVHFPTRKVKAIDTVGAGDSFNGALAYALDQQYSIHKAIKLANVVGSLTVQKRGAIPSLPSMVEVQKYLNKE